MFLVLSIASLKMMWFLNLDSWLSHQIPTRKYVKWWPCTWQIIKLKPCPLFLTRHIAHLDLASTRSLIWNLIELGGLVLGVLVTGGLLGGSGTLSSVGHWSAACFQGHKTDMFWPFWGSPAWPGWLRLGWAGRAEALQCGIYLFHRKGVWGLLEACITFGTFGHLADSFVQCDLAVSCFGQKSYLHVIKEQVRG